LKIFQPARFFYKIIKICPLRTKFIEDIQKFWKNSVPGMNNPNGFKKISTKPSYIFPIGYKLVRRFLPASELALETLERLLL